MITQHTTFLSDLPVREFLLTHSRCGPGKGESPLLVAADDRIRQSADRRTDRSGQSDDGAFGRTDRALLIADATVICSTPVVLLDEVENAGIHRTRAIQLLREYRKIFIFVTHDPRIALLSDFRIVMQGGSITRVLSTATRSRRFRCGSFVWTTPSRPAREAPSGPAGWTLRNCRRSHETGHLRRARHDRKDFRLRHATKKLLASGRQVAFLKLDVQYADEDELLAKEFGIPTRKVYTGELCPDHCHVMVLGDALDWAEQSGGDALLVETAGLCLRCAPYVDGGLGMIVLEATSGMNLPLKVGPMLSLADMAVVTKIDRVSQAEREVFRARIQDVAPNVLIREVNALHGIGIDPLVAEILDSDDVSDRCYSAAIRPWAPARFASARRISAGSRTSAWSARWRTRRFIGENDGTLPSRYDYGERPTAKVSYDDELPGLDCGICGYRTCEALREQFAARPELLRRCIHLSEITCPRHRRPDLPQAPPSATGLRRRPADRGPRVCLRDPRRRRAEQAAMARQPRPRV